MNQRFTKFGVGVGDAVPKQPKPLLARILVKILVLAFLFLPVAVNAQTFEEGFEGTTFPPANWTRFGPTATQWSRVTTAGTFHSGIAAARHSYATNGEGWLVTPRLSISDTGDPELTFWSRVQWWNATDSYGGVWVSTTGNDPATSTFVQLKSLIYPSGDTPYGEINVPLSDYKGQKIYIAFKYQANNIHVWYIDDVKITDAAEIKNAQPPAISAQPQSAEVPSGKPFSLSVTATSPDGGSLTYQWYSNETNSATGGTPILTATDKIYTVPTNEVGIFYYYVEITNEITDNGDGGIKTKTAPSAVAKVEVYDSNIPRYAEDFSNATFPPEGWTTYKLGDAGQWARATNVNRPGSTVGAAFNAAVNGHNENWLVTPKLAITSATSELKIWSTFINWAQNSATNKASVWISEGSADPQDDDFELLENIDAGTYTGYPDWHEIIVSLSAYEGKSVFIGIKYESNSSGAYHWYISDVKLIGAKKVLPSFTEGFDGLAFPPQGWTRYQLGATSVKWELNTATSNNQIHTGTGSAEHPRPTAGVHDGWLVMPQIEILTENSTLEFFSHIWIPAWWDTSSSGGVWISENSKNPDDGDFTLLRAITAGEHAQLQWTKIEVELGAYVGKKVYIGFRYGGGANAHRWIIDDVTVTDAKMEDLAKEALPPFIKTQPTPVTSTVVTNTPVSFTVVAESLDGGELSYQWYSNTTATNTGGTPASGATATKATYEPSTGTAGKFYYYVVVTNTIEGDLKAITPSSVVTLTVYAPLTTLTESFDATTFPPDGWAEFRPRTSGTNATNHWTRVATYDGRTGVANHGLPNGANIAESWLVTPQISISDKYELTFLTRIDNMNNWNDNTYLGVWVLTDSNNPSVSEQKVELKSFGDPADRLTTTWKEISISLSEYAGQKIYIAFKYTGNLISLDDPRSPNWYLDDISVKKAPVIIKTFPYTEDFNGDFLPDGWSSHDVTGSPLWVKSTAAQAYGATGGAARITFGAIGLLKEGWLVTPAIAMPATGDYQLTFMSKVDGYNATYTPDAYSGVWISSGANATASFVELKALAGTEITNTAWQKITVSVPSEYAGKTIYIAFKYYGTSAHTWAIDNVTVEKDPVVRAFPFTENFDGNFLPEGWSSHDVAGSPLWAKSTAAQAYGATGGAARITFGAIGLLKEGWLVTPALAMPATGSYLLKFMSKVDGYNATYTPDAYSGVWISSGANATASFVELKALAGTEITTNPWQEISVSIPSEYAGKTIYIAFKYYGTSAHTWAIDNVEVDITKVPIPVIDVHPKNETVKQDEELILTVEASVPEGNLSYQWYKAKNATSNTDGVLIPNATDKAYKVPTDVDGTFYFYVVVTNTIGEQSAKIESAVATVKVEPLIKNAQKPLISAQPQNKTVREGDVATLSVMASVSDGGTLTYQWYRNTTAANTGGTLIEGATNSTYDAPTVVASTRYFYVVITNTLEDNGDGGVKVATNTSTVATVKVNDAVYALLFEGFEDATFPPAGWLRYGGAGATGAWNRNTNASWIHSGVGVAAGTSAMGAFEIWLITPQITIPETENDVVLKFWSIHQSPAGAPEGMSTVRISTGGNAQTDFVEVLREVNASSSWQEITILLNDYKGQTIYLGFRHAHNIMFGPSWYIDDVTVEEVTENAPKPVITAQPQSQSESAGTEINLSVTVTPPASGTLSYQWFSNTTDLNFGGTKIEGATEATYKLPKTVTETPGKYYYYVVVTNTIEDNGDGGHKTATTVSNLATVTLTFVINAKAPVITAHPQNKTVSTVDEFTLAVEATSPDAGKLSYQWYKKSDKESKEKGEAIENATNATYVKTITEVGTYYYYVEVTNTIDDNGDGGEKTVTIPSEVATVTVRLVHAQTPAITAQPHDETVFVNDVVTLSVTATSPDAAAPMNGKLTYQWYSNTGTSKEGGTAIQGATESAYTVPTAKRGVYYFYVVVTNTIDNNGDGGNKIASVTSNVATVRVTGDALITEDFDGEQFPPVGWTTYELADEANVGTQNPPLWNPWKRYNTDRFMYRGEASAFHGRNLGNVTDGRTGKVETMLVTMELVVLVGEDAKLTFYSQGAYYNPENDLAHAGVWISTEGNDPEKFVLLKTFTPEEVHVSQQGTWRAVTVSLNEYAGKDIYLAFKYMSTYKPAIPATDTSEAIPAVDRTFNWWIDDVILEGVTKGRINAELPSIDTQPQDVLVAVGEAATISVTASRPDNGTLSYQWYINTTGSNAGGTAVEGATDNEYNVPTNVAGTFYYYVVVTNSIPETGDGGIKHKSVTSEYVIATVVGAPVITDQPQDVKVGKGAAASFAVKATTPNENGVLTYQWFKAASATAAGMAIAGATAATYAAPTTDIGTSYFYVEVKNTVDMFGFEKSSPAVKSNSAKLEVEQVTGSEDILTNPIRAWIRNGQLHVTGLTVGETLSVYNAAGSIVHRSVVASEEKDIDLTVRGMYIISTGKAAVKVVFD